MKLLSLFQKAPPPPPQPRPVIEEAALAESGVGAWSFVFADGRLSAPAAWFDALGWPAESRPANDDDWCRAIDPAELTAVRQARFPVWFGRARSYEVLYDLKGGDGVVRRILERGCTVERNPDETTARVAGVWIDISNQKSDGSRMSETSQFFEESGHMLALFDRNGYIIAANRALRTRCGLAENRSTPVRHVAELFTEDSSSRVLRDGMAQTLSSGSWHGEALMCDANGAIFPSRQDWRLHREGNDGPEFISLTARDLTSERTAEAESRAAERRAHRIRKFDSLGQLAGGLAHEFNNFLTSVMGNASLARTELAGNDVAQAYFKQIEDVSDRAAEQCQVLLAYAGRGQVEPAPAELNSLIGAWLPGQSGWIGGRARVSFEPDDDPCNVDLDTRCVRECLRELVANAVEASPGPESQVVIRTGTDSDPSLDQFNVCLPPELPPGKVRWFEVCDRGAGMGTTLLERLFEPFFSTKSGHVGLGLTHVLGIARSHGGCVLVRSEAGRGSCVRVVLPCGLQTVAPRSIGSAEAELWRGAGQILIVDDQAAIRVIATRLLEGLGFTPLVAADGQEAVRIFRQHAPALRAVLLDLSMPGMDGETTLEELRRINAEVPVVMMSGFNEGEISSRALASDIAGFLRKPFTIHTLSAALHRVLG